VTKLRRVVSSNIEGIGYDPESQRLTVLFKNGGAYDYHCVIPEHAQALRDAPSVGSFLHQVIKPRYQATRLRADVVKTLGWDDGLVCPSCNGSKTQGARGQACDWCSGTGSVKDDQETQESGGETQETVPAVPEEVAALTVTVTDELVRLLGQALPSAHAANDAIGERATELGWWTEAATVKARAALAHLDRWRSLSPDEGVPLLRLVGIMRELERSARVLVALATQEPLATPELRATVSDELRTLRADLRALREMAIEPCWSCGDYDCECGEEDFRPRVPV